MCAVFGQVSGRRRARLLCGARQRQRRLYGGELSAEAVRRTGIGQRLARHSDLSGVQEQQPVVHCVAAVRLDRRLLELAADRRLLPRLPQHHQLLSVF